MSKFNLTKDLIKDIRFYLKKEAEQHELGSWDKFYITSLELRTNGDYFFRIRWAINDHEDFLSKEGNLFDEFPIKAVLDGLDAVKLLMYDVHIKAYERLIKHTNDEIKKYNESNDYIKHHYNIK